MSNDPIVAPMSVAGVVQDLAANFECQPVLFVGAGLSRRYIAAPSWDGLLSSALDEIGVDLKTYDYLLQKHNGDRVKIGSHIADMVFEWAWGKGKNYFPSGLFTERDKSVFLKYIAASKISAIVPDDASKIEANFKSEIDALRQIRPHAIITTNYDGLLETIFDGYESIVGKAVLKYNLNAYGEVFHIHGSVDHPESIVITAEDYDLWAKRSKYFASKLLTYFVEHPVFIFGYGLGDPNIQTILRDIGEIVADSDGLIGNVMQVVWHDSPSYVPNASEYAIPANGNQYRIRVLNVTSLEEVFAALAARNELKNANPALVRSLAARVMQLTRKDIPTGNVEIDYATLEKLSATDDAVPKLFGLTLADNSNKTHPYVLSIVGEHLGMPGWHGPNKLLNEIKEKTGKDIKSSDNKYHLGLKSGKKDSSVVHKYSDAAVELLRLVMEKKAYQVDLP